MRPRVLIISLAVVLGGGFIVGVTPSPAAPPSPGYVKHEVLVGFTSDTSETARADVHRRHGGRVLERLNSVNADLVSIGNADAVAKRDEYKHEPSVRAVALNYFEQPDTTPNDPLFGSMWGLDNSGQTGGQPDADIDAPEAWDLSHNASSVIVADIDTGIDVDHPDLTTNIWTNPSPGAACVGSPPYPAPCADLHGWDFANEDPSVFDPSRAGDDFADLHGSHTAGTIGAVGDNGIGVAGVAWNVQLMPLKFLNFGFGTDADAIQSIDYARAHGAKVINASWGGGGFDQLLKDAIDRAGADGVVFVASAGNSARYTDTSPSYPASYASSNIIAVAATDDRDQLASFSNYGPTTVDLAAPGQAVWSTVPRSPAGVVWNGQLVYLAFGVEGLSSSSSRQDVIQRSFGYLSAAGRVLVVDDDAGKTYETYYTDALSSLGYDFDVVTVPAGGIGPTAAQMGGYAATIWLTGDDATQTFLTQDQTEVSNLLSSGGKLIVSGQDIGNDLDIKNRSRTWYRSTLHAQAISNNALNSDLTGEPGGPFAGLTASIAGGDGANNQVSPEKVWPLNGAAAALGYPPYATMSGTSMAAPHVTGAVALLRALKPTATIDEIKTWIFGSVDQLSSLAGKVATGGRLNLRRAMDLALSGDTTPPTVGPSTLTAPNGGEAWAGGSIRQITWDAASITDPYLASAPVKLEWSSNGGATWSLIADHLANTGAYSWQVPITNSTAALVKITATDMLGNGASDASDSVFTIDSKAPTFGTPTSTPSLFGPAAGGTSTFSVFVTEAGPDSWTLIIRNAAKTAVRTENGAGAFASYVWNGRDGTGVILPDGTYTWTVLQRDRAGNTATSKAGSVKTDSTPPTPKSLAVTPFSFDPTAGGTTSIKFTLAEPATVDVFVVDGDGAVVRRLAQGTALPKGTPTFVWNGRDDGGNLLPIARYQVSVTATDAVGNIASATKAAEIIAADAASQGSWVGLFGSRGYILPAWVQGNQADLASLPASVLSYKLNSGSRLVWASSSDDVRALVNPDGSVRAATAYSSATTLKVTITFQAADRAVLSLYLLDWDSTARREMITVTDADGSRSYPITASFQGGLWLRLPVSGTTQIPVTITAKRTAGTSAVVSGIMFD